MKRMAPSAELVWHVSAIGLDPLLGQVERMNRLDAGAQLLLESPIENVPIPLQEVQG